jgi:hypothetical protein
MREILELAARSHLELQELDELTFDGFLDASSGLSCLWRVREALRAQLGQRLWDFLPSEKYWPRDYTYLVGASLIMQIGCSEYVLPSDADRLLRGVTKIPKTVKIGKIHPRPLFLFIWNLYAFWLSRNQPLVDRFADLQGEEFWSQVESIIVRNASKARQNEDKLNVLALAGAYALLLPERASRIAGRIKGQIKGIRWLLKEAEALTFVPAAMAHIGLSLTVPSMKVIPPERRALLLAKADEYDERGPAIDFLCDWLRNGANPLRPGDRKK